MPMTYAEHDKKMKVPAVCELLPLRDLPQGDNVMVRTNGAFVAGYELKGVLSYFATDEDRNQAKSMLEALIRGVPDVSMRIQFRYEISEHLGFLFDDYVNQQRTQKSEVMALDAHRLRMWQRKEQSGYYFENRLHVYFIWDPRANFRGEAKFSTWLISITLNEARRRLRRQSTVRMESLDEPPEEGSRVSPALLRDWREIPSEALERREVRALLQQAIEQLSPIYREVVVLRDIEELSIEETAAMLAISISSVKVRLHRARIMLQKDLAPKLKLANPKKRRLLSWY